MAENNVSFAAMPKPTYDDFEKVTIWFGISESAGNGALTGHKDMTTREARWFAAEIIKACDIVDAEQSASAACTCVNGVSPNDGCLVHGERTDPQ
jgi:hypothetical protein